MKKYIVIMLIIVVAFCNVSFASIGTKEVTLNYSGITINIDDNVVVPKDVTGSVVDPFIIDGTTYLPVRAISESLGKEVSWNSETYTVYINDKAEDVSFENLSSDTKKKISQEVKTLNYNDISICINGKNIEPKDANGVVVEPFIIDGTTYLPVRAVAEAFDKKVTWQDETKTVFISSKKEIAKINNVVLKVIDNTLCAEITSDSPINSYEYYAIAEGRVVAEPYLNMRDSANTNSNIITTIPNESIISIKDVEKVGNSDAWYKVAYSNLTGWVSADYVEITPTRLVIDLKDTNFNIDTSSKNINYEAIDSIRFGDQGNNVSRIVLDLNQMTNFKVIQNDEKTVTYFALNKDFKLPATIKGEDIFVATNDDKLYLPEEDSGDDDNEVIIPEESGDNVVDSDASVNEDSSGDSTEDTDVKTDDQDNNVVIENLSTVDSIKYSSSTNKTKINIDGDYEYTAFTLTNPDRVVLDIKGATLNVDGPKEINPNNKNITAIRFSQNEKDIVRIVFDVNAKSDYIVTEKKDELTIELEEKTYKNIDYINYGTYATLILQDTDIDYFETDKSSTGDKYYITYSSRKFKSGTGTIEVNDEFVEDINIKSTKITIRGEKNVSYSIKQVGDNVVVTIKEKNAIENKVILLDVGHGGKDPGASNGDITEREYNLKIALKLREMLEETDGIEVRMSRTTENEYLDRTDRFNFILDNEEDADLFVSIHNNALDNKNYKGTMVLYYNKPGEEEEYGITSKEFAQIVKENLVAELETIDRGVVNRSDLLVLEQNASDSISGMPQSNLPAILCEVIFISNDEEAARLITDNFQQKAAQAIYDGIIEALSVMDEKN